MIDQPTSTTQLKETKETTMALEKKALNKLIGSRDVLDEKMNQIKTELAGIEPGAHLAAARAKLEEAAENAADEATLTGLAEAVQTAANGSDDVGIHRTILQGRLTALARQAETLDAHIAQAQKNAVHARIAALEAILEKETRAFEKVVNAEMRRCFRFSALDKALVMAKTEIGLMDGRSTAYVEERFVIPVPAAGRNLGAARECSAKWLPFNYPQRAEQEKDAAAWLASELGE